MKTKNYQGLSSIKIISFVLILFLASFQSFSQGGCSYPYVDNGGVSGDYLPNTSTTTTFCPSYPSEVVTITFSSFNVQSEYDGWYVYDGSSIADPLISSTNPAGYVPGGLAGAFWGSTIPGPFTASNPSGCLTFVYKSDAAIQNSGYTANVSCGPPPSGFNLIPFLDANNNGIKEVNEVTFPLGDFQYQKNGGATLYTSGSFGNNYLSENNPTNTYDFTYQLYPNYSSMYSFTGTNYTNVSTGTFPNLVTLYFPVISLINTNDLSVNVTNLSKPKAGATYISRISYTNNGDVANGTITFTNDSANTITNITAPNSITTTPTGFSLNFYNLAPFETRYVDVRMSVPSIPTVSIGQLMTNSASISTPATESNYSNNNSSFTEAVVASYDPNDITESHGEKIVYSTFAPDDYLFYTVRFENTGTAPASDVEIVDVLNSNIDETSIQLVSSSYPNVLNRNGNTISWKFNNIELPVSIPNTNTGKGFVTFKVKLKPGFTIGTIIPNTASIYFDSNPTIVTNTFNTEFVSTLSNLNFVLNSDLKLTPIPTKEFLNIKLNQNATISSISIFNTIGQLVLKVSPTNDKLDVKNLESGLYFIKIESDKGLYQSKFIKE